MKNGLPLSLKYPGIKVVLRWQGGVHDLLHCTDSNRP
jgi:hypothetical protein